MRDAGFRFACGSSIHRGFARESGRNSPPLRRGFLFVRAVLFANRRSGETRRRNRGRRLDRFGRQSAKADDGAYTMTEKRTNWSGDHGRIDLSREDERRNWTKRLGVTDDELKNAVREAGESSDKVRDYLQVKAFIKRLRDYVKRRKSRPGPEQG